MKKRIWILIIVLLAALFGGQNLLSDVGVPSNRVDLDGMLSVAYIDVGQGDSALITMPGGTTALIDAGESTAEEAVIGYLNSRGISRLDYVICTHPHSDHIGGMRAVIEQFDIGAVYMPKAYHDSRTFEKLLLAIEEKGLTVKTAKAGVSFTPEESISLDFVAPVGDNYDDLNNYSAVLRLSYDDTSFLFTGDAEKLSENEMVESRANLQADVLKVGHHGSSTSSGQRFLNAVDPTWVVISVGADNEYGHPHIETMASLESRRGVKHILRTDEEGTIVLVSDGDAIRRQEEAE